MELRTILTFLKVAECNSFSRAAEKLGYSQSAVTVQIQQLEHELGSPLFERVGKGVKLTEQGQNFIFHANEILSAVEQAVGSARQGGAPQGSRHMTGTLRIGSVESIATAILPPLLLEYHRRFPQVELVVSTARRDSLLDQIRRNTLDLLLTLDPKLLYSGLQRLLIGEEPILFIAPSSLSHLAGHPVPLEELTRLPFVLTERGESYRYELDRILANLDSELHAQLEIGNTETIVHMVEAGFGLSFLPRFSAEEAIRRGAVFPVETDLPSVQMWIQLLYHKNKWISPPMRAFLDLLQEHFLCGSDRQHN